jgi:hypothetical protein
MYRTASDPTHRVGRAARTARADLGASGDLRLLSAGVLATILALARTGGPLAAQDPATEADEAATEAARDAATSAPQPDVQDAAQAARRLVGYATDIDGGGAELTLEFAGGREVAFEVRDGRVYVDGRRLGTFDEAAVGWDDSWRDLLRDLDGSPADVARRVEAWEPSGEGIQQALDDALDDYLSGAAGPEAYGDGPGMQALEGAGDSVTRLNVRIRELESVVDELRSDRERIRTEVRNVSRGVSRGLFWHIRHGAMGILATMMKYALLLAIGFGIIYFGGRPYLETVADAARRQPVRAWAVGFAGAFLLIPAFVIGILVLVVSIVGIPALLVWVPGFPIAVLLSLLLGFLAVAHGAGEIMAERRFQGVDWLHRANSFHYLMTGLGLLLALPLAAYAIGMVGFLGFFEGLLSFVGGAAIWIAATIGFGAVLMTRAGTRQPDGSRTKPASVEHSFVEEEELGV